VPELPDVTVYVEALERRLRGQTLERVRVWNPFLVRTVRPPLEAASGRRVVGMRRLAKRIVFCLEDDLFLSLHLMIAGRLHWKAADAKVSGRATLALFDFPAGKLVLTEQGSKRRAALHVVAGEAALAELDRGGVEPLEASPAQSAEALRRESHTVKRTLTDPRLFSGIGNAYPELPHHLARPRGRAVVARPGRSRRRDGPGVRSVQRMAAGARRSRGGSPAPRACGASPT
jgi:formamidopyrimidine-DNA glycosylase